MDSISIVIGFLFALFFIGLLSSLFRGKKTNITHYQEEANNGTTKNLRYIFHHLERSKEEAAELMKQNQRVSEKNALDAEKNVRSSEINDLNKYRFDTHKERFILDMDRKGLEVDKKEALLEIRERNFEVNTKAIELEFERKAFKMIQNEELKRLELEKFKFQIVKMIYEENKTFDKRELSIQYDKDDLYFQRLQMEIKRQENEVQQKYSQLKFLESKSVGVHLQNEIRKLKQENDKMNYKNRYILERLANHGYYSLDEFIDLNIKRKMLD
jgi:hypothetical protein